MTDPVVVHTVLEYLGPAIVIASIGMSISFLVFVSKHFKLRTRELEVKAPLHAQETDARLRALEMRQVALEAAVTALVGSLSALVAHRSEAPPPAALQQPSPLMEGPATSAEPARLVAVPPQRLR